MMWKPPWGLRLSGAGRLSLLALAVALIASACSSGGDEEGSTGEPPDSTRSAPDSEVPVDDTTTVPSGSSAPAPVESAPPPAGVARADVTGPIVSDNGPTLPQPATALPAGYVEEEFFVSGEASSYETVGDEGADGFWDARPLDTADYRTRILVRRPPAERFSGVVIVEWLNVSAVEASPDWGYLSEEIGRAGHAYVAVSAQALGVVGGESLLAVELDEDAAAAAGTDQESVDTGGLVNADPDRYGTLRHPGDTYAYDIFGQVGGVVRTRADTVLGGLDPATVIAAGESQSAGFLTTYLNAVHPIAPAYDGFLVHSRGAGGAPIDGGFGAADDEGVGSSFVDDGVRIRTDLTEPVFILQTETDLTLLGYTLARQPDTDSVRTWEVAGTAHADAHVFRAILGGPRDPSLGSLLGCTRLINSGPHHEVAQAALAHLVEWTQGGPPPPGGDRIEVIEGDEVVILRDELGMAIGGVRNPLVDVPVAVVTGDPWGEVSLDSAEEFDLCDLFGQTIPLERDGLIELHGSADDYVAAFRASTAAAVDGGFLLPADAEKLLEEAEANRALFEPS
jgi:Alpha/beta hydrolase domain